MSDDQRFYCNSCRRETNQKLRYEYETVWHDQLLDNADVNHYRLYSCAGCETATLTVREHDSFHDESEAEDEFYPMRNRREHHRKFFQKLPLKLNSLYDEIIRAFNDGCFLLCTLGLRTLLEAICADKGAKGNNLGKKIESLREFLPTGNITDYLHGYRFSGNDAAHDLEPLSGADAKNAIIVMEDLLNVLYDFDYRASKIKNADKAKASAATNP